MDAERWLSPDEQATWRAYLVSYQLFMRDLDRQLRADSGITHTDYALLVSLSDRQAGGPARVTELASFLDHSQSRTSHAVARLERAGLLRREPDPDDGRVVNVALTEAGRDALRTAAPGHVRRVREVLFDDLDPDQLAAFRVVCEAMRDRLHRPVAPTPCGGGAASDPTAPAARSPRRTPRA